MKQFIQYLQKIVKQRLKRYLYLCLLCGGFTVLLSGCKQSEPEVTLVLDRGKDTGAKTSEEVESSENTEDPEEDDVIYVEISPSDTAASSEMVEDTEWEQVEEICVYVCGCVKNPAVYHLPGDSRIGDAVEAAGGLTETAARDYWNLAELLSDGDMIYFPSQEEAEDRKEDQSSAKDSSMSLAGNLQSQGTSSGGTSQQNGTSGNSSRQSASGASASGLVNINTADSAGLMTLPGIGETRAASIIAYRQEHGNFAAISDIKNVSGIGDALFENMKSMITVSE